MQPLTFFQPVLYAVFTWWFMTGLIFAVYGRSYPYKILGFALATIFLGLALWGIIVTRQQTHPLYIYASVTCGMVLWGWQVASYYLGFITGPRPLLNLARPPYSFTQRFWHAFRAGLYHELTVLGFALLLIFLTWSQPNRWGLWMFLVLWLMHSMAKLNVFLGVRNFRIDFMPKHMHYLTSLLGQQRNNYFVPFTLVMAISFSLTLIYQGVSPHTMPGQTVGFLLVGTMVALGALEILLLILPLSMTLWGWTVRPLSEQGGES